MSKDKYFFFIASFNRKSPDYMKPLSLIRLHYAENGGFHAERWNGEAWVFDRNGISACGNGGDNPYERISEAEAKAMVCADASDGAAGA